MSKTLPVFPADELVGKPFVILPGNPDGHKVVAEWRGDKVRAGGIMQVWNDALLAISMYGGDAYMQRCGERERNYLRIGERLYGTSFTSMLETWQAIPNIRKAIIWREDGTWEVRQ